MDKNCQIEDWLKTIKSMEKSDLMSAYRNRSDYNPEFAKLLLEEMSIRGYDVEKLKESFENIDVTAMKGKGNDELIDIYYKRENYKYVEGWDILAKNELKNRGIDVEQQTNKKTPMSNIVFLLKVGLDD